MINWAITTALKAFIVPHINGCINKYGGTFILDWIAFEKSIIYGKVHLKGEDKELVLTITYHTWIEGALPPHAFIKVISIQSSRQWIDLVSKDLIDQGVIKQAQLF